MMVDTFGMTGMIVLAFLALAAVYIFLKLMGRPESDDEEDEKEGESAAYRPLNTGEMSDGEFIESYTGAIMDDAMESLELAVMSIGSGLHFYEEGKYEVAGDDFHSAVKKLDEASEKFREVPGMVEDQGLRPVVRSKARIDESLLLRALTIRMEEACDAMAEGKKEEAQKSAMVKKELEERASAFNASL